MPAHRKTLTVSFIACFLLSACSSASPTSVIPTGTPVELNIPSSTPSPTMSPTHSIPTLTSTPDFMTGEEIPTPKVELAGLIAELGDIQSISPEEAQLRIQKAIDTITVEAPPKDTFQGVQYGHK
jgi:hypothetical protein